jgi:type II secretory pathway pseudopilin PulG
MSPDYFTILCLLAAVALVAVVGPLLAIGLYMELGRVNEKLKAADVLLDAIVDQTDSKREEKAVALGKQLKAAFPEIADGVDNRGFGMSVYDAHKVFRKAASAYGTPGSRSWTKKANAKAAVLAESVGGFYGHSIISRIPSGEWKKRLTGFIQTGA